MIPPRLLFTGAVLAACLPLLCAPLTAQQHAGSVTREQIEAGATLYAAQCAACHGAEGNLVVGVDLRRGAFRAGPADEDLARVITEGIPGTAMVAHKFTPAELSALIAFIRSMASLPAVSAAPAFEGGDAGRGQLLVEGKGKCLLCHRIYGRGSRQATNLSDIGSLRAPDAIARALADPGTSVAPRRRFVRAVTREGRVVTGQRLNEDSFTVQLLDEQERLVSLVKAELREYTVSTSLDGVPHAITLTDEERRDVVAYLLSLKGLDPTPPRGVSR